MQLFLLCVAHPALPYPAYIAMLPDPDPSYSTPPRPAPPPFACLLLSPPLPFTQYMPRLVPLTPSLRCPPYSAQCTVHRQLMTRREPTKVPANHMSFGGMPS